VTIIAGFKGYNGIVLCSDTQETVVFAKRRVSKLRIEPSDGKGSIGVAFCGAGEGPFIDKLVELAWEDVQTSSSLDAACEEIEKSIKRTYKEYGQIYQRGYCPHAELIFGVTMNFQSKLFHASGPIVNEKKTYSTAGAGQYMADFLAARMYKDWFDIRTLEILAAYILFQAKENVDGCGGESEIGILRDDGISGMVDKSHIESIIEVVNFSDELFAEALLQSGDFGMKKAEFVKTLKNTMNQIRETKKEAMEKSQGMRYFSKITSIYGSQSLDELGIPKPNRKRRIFKRSTSRK